MHLLPALPHSFCSRLAAARTLHATAAAASSMDSSSRQQQQQGQPPAAQQEEQPQQSQAAPAAEPHHTLEDLDTLELNKRRNQILWDQATKGQQPGLTLMQDRLSGDDKQESWGMEPTIMEPDKQN